MISTKAERESFRKSFEKLIPQIYKAKIVDNFEKKGKSPSTL